MQNQNDQNGLTTNKKLKEENEFLKNKLTSEFGMKGIGSNLPDEAENEWLNYIYNFEKIHKEAKRVKLYDFIGKPVFKKIDELTTEEITPELNRLLDIIENNMLEIFFCCDYDDMVIYKFITEELFEEEIDDVRIPEMRTCFNYEEFHPNHEYDIKKISEDFFGFLFKEKFNEEHFNFLYLNDSINYEGIKYIRKELLKKLIEFREIVKPAGIELLEFYKAEFDLESCYGKQKVS